MRPLVDRLLLEQGRLDPFELLLAADRLTYRDYEDWRSGRRPSLVDCLVGTPDEVAGWLDRASAYAVAQRLVPILLTHRRWGSSDAILSVGEHPGLARGCATAYAPGADRRQLDLFHDSTAALLEDEIRTALAERRTERARERLAQLLRQDPKNPRVRGYLQLLETVEEPDPTPGCRSSGDRLRDLLSVEPLAGDLLGHRARDFLCPLWVSLAEALAGHPFDPTAPELHAAFAWARAGHWAVARRAIESEPGWHDRVALVRAHADACWQGRDPAGARRDWLRLCWEWPREADHRFRARDFPDRRLAELWDVFGDLDEALETEDFPAWLLVREPGGFVAVTPDSAPSDERGDAYRLLHRMANGDDGVEIRRALDDLQPALLRLFLARIEEGSWPR